MKRTWPIEIALWLAAWALLLSCARGEVVEVPPIRQSGYSGVLGELEDRMPAGHQYRASHPGTWAHETTHGLNSRIRNSRGGTGQVNAAYLYGGHALVLPEPPLTLTEVARAVPRRWRGRIYGLYMVEQAGDWNNEPLYVLDELSAYINGAVSCIQAGRNDHLSSDLVHAAEMQRYAIVLWRLATAKGYRHHKELENFLWLTNEYIKALGGRGVEE